MPYKHLQQVLTRLNYLSTPGVKDYIETFYQAVDDYLGAVPDSINQNLATIVTGYQYGYSVKSVTEYLLRQDLEKLFQQHIAEIISSVNQRTNTLNTIQDTFNLDVQLFHPSHPFYQTCQYDPASDEWGSDPLRVIDTINQQRKERQLAADPDKTQGVIYPVFGTWVENTIKITTTEEMEAICEFRRQIVEYFSSIYQLWYPIN